MEAEIDLYELLGVSSEATEKELTKGYRLKALQHHPDKNRDNPSAPKLFHDIKTAYDILSNPQKRSEYNEKRRALISKRQRQDALDSQRKKMKSQLERDEQVARDARMEATRRDAELFSREAEREQKRRDREIREQMQRTYEQEEVEESQSVDELDRSVRIRWNESEMGARGQDDLARIFGVFGDIEEVVVAPVSLHRRKTGAMSSALVVFRTIGAAHALMSTPAQDPRLRGFSRFWATGTEPQAVHDTVAAAAAAAASARVPEGAGVEGGVRRLRIPDIASIDVRGIAGSNLAFADFEALTLMRMRQTTQ
ncbi:hypothetical protein GGI07_003594 [Coemansia sp. Benny D115]|nr:hypothetical protein GGI07_003594 [Coemansia sp. Benny D115]